MTTTAEAAQVSLRSTVHEIAEMWRARGGQTGLVDAWGSGFEPEFSKLMADRGLIGMAWPKHWGGGGHSYRDRLAVTEELLRLGLPVTAHWIADRQIGPAILRSGSDHLKREFLPAIRSADAFFCLGMSEPGAGSDLANVSTRAVREAGGWRVSGRKIWTTYAHRATHIYLLVRTGPGSSRHEGLTEMLSPIDASGIEVTAIRGPAGAHHFNEVLLDEVFVPDEYVLGEVGNGWRQVVEQLSFERGGAERFLTAYPQFKAVVDSLASGDVESTPEVVARIGELSARLAVLRHMAWDLAGRLDRDEAPVVESAALKLRGTQFEADVVELLRSVNGGRAVLAGTPLGSLALAVPTFSIRGGASDVLMSIIARQEMREE
jgi:acyl-CoA dehydrogenase